MKRIIVSSILLSFTLFITLAQPMHRIKGVVIDNTSRRPLEFVNVVALGTSTGTSTDSTGHFSIPLLKPGIYRLQASALGYKETITSEYILSTKDLHITIELEENPTELSGITVTASPFRRRAESPVSLRTIGLQEIEKSPGANRDISRIVQSYPGVAFSPAGYRNDLIVRGGAPSENRFYLDEVEIPNINHFSTQGASGGPVGIINADLIREVNFYTGAFPAEKGNAMSSVLDFKLRDGDMEKNSFKATLGASEASLTSNGHLGKKTSYLVSLRQSYLQFLFKALGLPFLPTYTDAQFKLKTRLNSANELTLLGLAGIDNMRLNKDPDGEDAKYILGYLPKIQQETFTLGGVYKHFAGHHVQTIVLSHSYMNNRNTKYTDNDESSEENLSLKLRSTEQETKFRMENSSTIGSTKISFGAKVDYVQYSNDTYQKRYTNEAETIDYHAWMNLVKWGIFGKITYESTDDRFSASLGMRTDANNYSDEMKDISKQLSPRLSLSYRLTTELYLNGSVGLYYQLPAYTSIGFKDNDGVLVNKANLRYMSVSQKNIGLSWRINNKMEFSAEGFYKDYDNIPYSIADGIPLACKGNDYGVVGNEALLSTAEGRSYGMELLLKWIVAQKINLSSSFTLFKSEYRNSKEAPYMASAWDNRYIFNLNGTYNLPRNWSAGMKISYIGGAPYTPYDTDRSSLVSAWNAQGKPYYDYSRYNTERLPNFGQIDVRVDKTYYIGRCMLGFYIDIQNISGSKFKQPDILMSTGVIENPTAPLAEQRYQMKYIKKESGTILPTIGITVEL
ncbi:TonB-dependent receptor [Bacteroides ihuae]|uniref:TonB-dependent receptor n=1 Tax=Bacteroides ihuae TaxID=1852362 RepID=UPI0008DA65B6|nr:carboxypeptidase-like regulatory domain-containing protein [Bacteroides ihuae]